MALHQPAQPGQLPGPVGVDLLPLLGRSRVEFELVAVGQDTLGGQVGVADDELGQVTTGERDGAVDEIALLGGGAQFHAPVPAPGGEHHLICARAIHHKRRCYVYRLVSNGTTPHLPRASPGDRCPAAGLAS